MGRAITPTTLNEMANRRGFGLNGNCGSIFHWLGSRCAMIVSSESTSTTISDTSHRHLVTQVPTSGAREAPIECGRSYRKNVENATEKARFSNFYDKPFLSRTRRRFCRHLCSISYLRFEMNSKMTRAKSSCLLPRPIQVFSNSVSKICKRPVLALASASRAKHASIRCSARAIALGPASAIKMSSWRR